MLKKFVKAIFIIFFTIVIVNIFFQIDAYVNSQNKETFNPEIPENVQHIIIKNNDKDKYYLINNKFIINEIVKSLKNLSTHMYCCDISTGEIFFLKDGLVVETLPLISTYSLKAETLMTFLKTPPFAQKMYEFNVPKVCNYDKLVSNIKEYNKNFFVFYPDSNYNSQHSYVDVEYVDNINNFPDYKEADFTEEYNLGDFKPDDILIPLKKYLENKHLLYNSSKVHISMHSTGGDFCRQMQFYLTRDITEQELKDLVYLNKYKGNTSFNPVQYKKIEDYELNIISRKKIKNIDSFIKMFNLKKIAE